MIQIEELEGQYIAMETNLSPHLPDIFKNHVAVPIKCSDTTQQLFVIPTINKDLLGENNSI